MQTKTIIKLLIVLGFLIGLWYFQSYRQKSQSEQASNWGTLSVDEVSPDQVNQITITKATDSLQFTKSNTDWLVDGSAADVLKVNQLLDVIRSPQAEVVSQNQDRYQELNIADDQAHQLKFQQGENQNVIFYISTTNSDIVRKSEHQNVYRLATPLNLNTSVTSWLAPPTPTQTPGE